MGGLYTQIRPPPPSLTERTLSSQHGKTFLIAGDVTPSHISASSSASSHSRTSHSRSGRRGGNGGVVFELATILYYAGAHVWITAPNEDVARETIDDIKNLRPTEPSFGRLDFITLDLNDLDTIACGARKFLTTHSKLHCLFHHASPALRPRGTKSPQGHDVHMARNILGPFLLTKCLLPALRATAMSLPNARVRIVFTAALAVDTAAPRGGMDLKMLGIQTRGTRGTTRVGSVHSSSRGSTMPLSSSATTSTLPSSATSMSSSPSRLYIHPTSTPSPPTPKQLHTATSVGAWFLASTLGTSLSSTGILCLAANPGLLTTDLIRHTSRLAQRCVGAFAHPPVLGACTLLWAGVSDKLDMRDVGGYVVPWGRVHPAPRADLLDAMAGGMRRREREGEGEGEGGEENTARDVS